MDTENVWNLQMQPRAIKRIIKQETDDFFVALGIAARKEGIMSDRISPLRYIVNERLDACETYEDLNAFLLEFVRISLEEWVASL